MYAITVPRADFSSGEIVEVLCEGLGPRYNVLPGERLTRAPFSAPVPGTGDTIVVGRHDNRVWRAQVTIVHRAASTELRVSPGGLVVDLVLNALGVASKTHRVLSRAPGINDPA